MRKALIDTVAKAIGPNPALTYITVFGSRHTVMVTNARTRRLIATVHSSGPHEKGDIVQYQVIIPGNAGMWFVNSLPELVSSLSRLPGYVQGKDQNYSKAVYKSAITY